jgi:thiol-disulfide isomerase/thioredoxin
MPRVSAPTTVAILGVGLVLVVTRSPDSGLRPADATAPGEARLTLAAGPYVDSPTATIVGDVQARRVIEAAPVVVSSAPEDAPPIESLVIEAREVLDAFAVPEDRLALDTGSGVISRSRFAAREDGATLVALVASWCAPCARELPALLAFSRASEETLVIVSLDDVAGPESLTALVEDLLARSEPMSQRLPALSLRADPDGAWTDATAPLLVGRGDPGALPQTLFFGAGGCLDALVQGPFDDDIAARLATHLELAELTP